jgi:Asp-tRNA(Asn)/Glu-tRNA(Gln) amidotransferase A subunit family amidase
VITTRSAIDLAGAIRRGELSAVEVARAHIELHRRVAPRINALVAERFDAALEEAAAADARVAVGGELPPLLGVPFTVKETIALEGMPQSAGLVARRDYRSTSTAPAVKRLIESGAIPLGVTNTSELTLWIESNNRLYGRTSNPYDPKRTAGGSSGGEGAAVGSGGSPFGVASDIAGSIRIPALFCGVFGHKPSTGVVSNDGMWPPTTGDSARMLGVGPLARRAEDLMPLLRVMADAPASLGEPDDVPLAGLTVTTVEDSSRISLSQAQRDARERAVGALIAAGASVRCVHLPSWRRAISPYLAALQDGSGSSHPTLKLLEESGEERPSWRSLASREVPYTVPTRVALAAELLPERTRRARALKAGREIASELIDAIGDGVVLHPAHPRTAPRHGRTLGRPWLLTPAAVFNLAQVPVTEVPLGLSEDGLPVGVQVAAGRERDHVSIAVALELERVFGGWQPPF